MRRQVAPLADRQVAEVDTADAHPLEPGHKQADLLAHAADLALFAFLQHKPQLLRVLPLDARRPQRLAVQAQTVAQQGEFFRRESGLHIAAFPAAAQPPVWVVRDADSTIVLFGSVHLLPPGLGARYRSLHRFGFLPLLVILLFLPGVTNILLTPAFVSLRFLFGLMAPYQLGTGLQIFG